MTVETRSQIVELSGDDRLRTVKIRDGEGRVIASAVGEGSVVVQAVHARLVALRQSEAGKASAL